MTYITRFRIDGLAGRPGFVEHTLDRYTNIFWGLNGTGKTTVLHILDAALSNSTRPLEALPFQRAVVEFYSENLDRHVVRTYVKDDSSSDSRDSQVTIGLQAEVTLGGSWAVTESNDHDPGWESEILGGPLEGEYEGEDEDYASSRYQKIFLPISRVVGTASRSQGSRSAKDPFVQRINDVWRQYSAESLVKIESVQRQGFASVLAILFGGTKSFMDVSDEPMAEQTVDATEAYRVVSSFLRHQRLILPLGKEDFARRYDESSENQRVVAGIQRTNAIVDEIRAPQREFQAVIDEMFFGNKHVDFGPSGPSGVRAFAVRTENDKIPLSALSSGEKQVLQILLETLAASSSAILIDEPEISLHPDWQKRLVGSMRRVNSEAQFILASHSPELMLQVSSECAFEL